MSLAEDLRYGRSVALNVLRPELAAVVGVDRFLAGAPEIGRIAMVRLQWAFGPD